MEKHGQLTKLYKALGLFDALIAMEHDKGHTAHLTEELEEVRDDLEAVASAMLKETTKMFDRFVVKAFEADIDKWERDLKDETKSKGKG